MAERFENRCSVVLGDDGWWYVLTPGELYDKRFRKEEDARQYLTDLIYREEALDILTAIDYHLEQDKVIQITYPTDLIRHLYRSIHNGFSQYYLHDAYLGHIKQSCNSLYYQLTNFKNENAGAADFEVDELCHLIMALYEHVREYEEPEI